MKRIENSGNRGFSNHRQKSNPRGPSHGSYNRLKADPDFDVDFYREVSRKKSRDDFLDCRIVATRTDDERKLRAFVKAMFLSKSHQREVSACIRGYVGKRAIPALLWNLDRLPPLQRMVQSRLACLVGHLESFHVYCDSVRLLEPLSGDIRKSVDTFLTDHSGDLLPGLSEFLRTHNDESFLLWAPYFHKHAHDPITVRLTSIASNTAAAVQLRNTALRLLVGFSPKTAVTCLTERGEGLPLSILLRRMDQLETSEVGRQHLPELLREFSRQADNRRLAAILFAPATEDDARKTQFNWITDELNRSAERRHDDDLHRQVQRMGQRLCRNGNPEWIAFLETAAKGGRHNRYARQVLIASRHPAGLDMLCAEIDTATKPENTFHTCVMAIRTYRQDSLCILNRVVASGHAKLLARVEAVAAEIWPGKSINDLIAERDSSLKASEPKTDPITTPTEPRSSQRSIRTITAFDRDRSIVEEVKSLEQHSCQTCGRILINALTGEPYSEAHHLRPLGHGGSDTLENLLCLCPLCHALFHLGCLGIDSRMRLHLAVSISNESVLTTLRVATSRRISLEALQYHWSRLFVPPIGVRFDDQDSDAASRSR